MTYDTLERGVKVAYDFKNVKGKIVFRFVSDLKPTIQNGFVQIADMKILCDKDLSPKIEKVKYKTYGKTHLETTTFAYTIDYSAELTGDININFAFEL